MRRALRRFAWGVAIAASLGGAARAAPADYPSRYVTVIVPFAPGGASDFVARILQPRLTEALGQQIVIENRSGAAGNIGMTLAARAAPDGYTLFLGNVGTLAINPSVFASSLSVNPLHDFAAVTLVADTPDILVAAPRFPPASVPELVAYVGARPGAINFASPGSGSLNRLEMELFRNEARLDMVHVPYKGGAGQAVTDLLAGQVSLMFTTLPSAIAFVRAGSLKPLALSSRERIAALPEIPTMAESGYPDVVSSSWQGLVAPAGTPAPILERLYAVVTQILGRDDVRQQLAIGGTDAMTSPSRAAFTDFIAAETRRWAIVVKESGAIAD